MCKHTKSVCQSNAGYYIGVMCIECGPVTRYSDYFATKEDAQAVLESTPEVNYWER